MLLWQQLLKAGPHLLLLELFVVVGLLSQGGGQELLLTADGG